MKPKIINKLICTVYSPSGEIVNTKLEKIDDKRYICEIRPKEAGVYQIGWEYIYEGKKWVKTSFRMVQCRCFGKFMKIHDHFQVGQ